MLHFDQSPSRRLSSFHDRSATLPQRSTSTASAVYTSSPDNRTDIGLLKEQLCLARDHCAELQARCDQVEDQLEKAQADNETLQRSLDLCTAKLGRVSAQLVNTVPREEYDALQTAREALEAKLVEVADLREDIAARESSLARLRTENGDVQRHNDQLAARIRELKETKHQDEKKFEAILLEYQTLADELESCKSNLAKCQEERQELHQQITLLQESHQQRAEHATSNRSFSNISLVSISTLTPESCSIHSRRVTVSRTPSSPAAESMVQVRTRDLELKLEETRCQLAQLLEEKSQLERQAELDRARIEQLVQEVEAASSKAPTIHFLAVDSNTDEDDDVNNNHQNENASPVEKEKGKAKKWYRILLSCSSST